MKPRHLGTSCETAKVDVAVTGCRFPGHRVKNSETPTTCGVIKIQVQVTGKPVTGNLTLEISNLQLKPDS